MLKKLTFSNIFVKKCTFLTNLSLKMPKNADFFSFFFLGIFWLKIPKNVIFQAKNTSILEVLGLKISKKWPFLAFFK